MKVKTATLKGTALDWAVAKCEGREAKQMKANGPVHLFRTVGYEPTPYEPSTNWAQGGPIIERLKGFEFKQWLQSKPESCCEAHIHNYDGDWIQFGPTPLIAAMRCYVASKLGDEVEVLL